MATSSRFSARAISFARLLMNETAPSELAISPDAQDALSAIYVLRAIPFKAGERMTMPVSDNGATYDVQLTVGQPDLAGFASCFNLTPTIFRPRSYPSSSGERSKNSYKCRERLR